MQVTVGPKYQVVIPKEVRNKIKGFSPGNTVVVKPLDEYTVTVKTAPQDWVARTRGMMTKAWKGIDTDKELEKMRSEWDERLNGLEVKK